MGSPFGFPPAPDRRPSARRPPAVDPLAPHVRLAAWYVTGPLGHLVAGALDVGELLGRWLWSRARGRRLDWF